MKRPKRGSASGYLDVDIFVLYVLYILYTYLYKWPATTLKFPTLRHCDTRTMARIH